MHDVLEHVGDPNKLIREISMLIKKKGNLFIKVPNSLSLQVEYLKECAWEISPPFHRTLFSKKSLNLLLKRHNFKVKEYFQDENSWGWGRGIATNIKMQNEYEKLRNNEYFRKFDINIDLLLEKISMNLNKPTVLFLVAEKND